MRTDAPEMTDVEAVVNNFASSARAGRRNAVPDIQGAAGIGGTSKLPLELEALSIKEGNSKILLKISNASLLILSFESLLFKCFFFSLLFPKAFQLLFKAK